MIIKTEKVGMEIERGNMMRESGSGSRSSKEEQVG